MRLLASVIVLAVALGYVFRGRLAQLKRLRLRWWGLTLAGLGLQFLPLPEGRGGTDALVRTGILAASYALLVVFAMANLRQTGMPLVALGLACNGLVIVANGGMPVSVDALRDSGQSDVIRLLIDEGADKHHQLTDDDVLTFLSDIIPIPEPIGQVASVGDVLVYAGIIWLVVAAMRERNPSWGSAAPAQTRGRHRRGAPIAVREPPPRRESPPPARRSGTEP
jgi:hypothetical protein